MALRLAAGRISVRPESRLRSTLRCMASTSAPLPYQILEYKYVPDILAKRGPYRADHLEAATRKAQEGKIVLAGAVGDPVDSAVFIWKGVTEEEIKAFVQSDPYHRNGLLVGWAVKPYTVVAKIESLQEPKPPRASP